MLAFFIVAVFFSPQLFRAISGRRNIRIKRTVSALTSFWYCMM
jgi:hypothetical protein